MKRQIIYILLAIATIFVISLVILFGNSKHEDNITYLYDDGKYYPMLSSNEKLDDISFAWPVPYGITAKDYHFELK